ncbi:MAG: haloacid dehalogenase-like hydrolase [Clostridia bacterium]|nr:haloacid dehalogenase-like hydrolase [Clostridia bacterium]
MKTKIAIVYDFDKTLSTDDMQAFGFIQALGLDPKDFWHECDSFGEKYKIDNVLAYMYIMHKKMKEKGIPLTKEYLYKCGKNVKYFKGLDTWFDRINEFGRKNDVEVEHYVISSGTREIIEGTTIAKYFKEIFACYFIYENGEAVWPALAINYTNKTQFIYRINKGILDIRDTRVNDEMPHSERPIPFSNIIYVGDSQTDIPSMRLVYNKGGTSIGLYQKNSKNEGFLRSILQKERISYVAEADYSENGEFDTIVKGLIKKTMYEKRLHDIRKKQKTEK